MNTPYIKQYNELGELTNPIQGALRNASPNRRARRSKQPRFMSNAKSFPLLLVGNGRFRKRIQWIMDKQVIHYDQLRK